VEVMAILSYDKASLRNKLYDAKAVISEEYTQNGEIVLKLRQKKKTLAQINSMFNNELEASIVKPKGFTFKVNIY
jgi:hypothetical protein